MSRRDPDRREEPEKETILLGVGFDGDDGHRRVTKGPEFLLLGGSEETHEVMQEKAIRFSEELERRSMRLGDVRTPDELREIAEKAGF
jgi:hypothetical protein